MGQKQALNSGETRREEIIRTAAKIFAAKGYHATSLEEIAAEIGITKPALYYHIKNKQEILQEVIGRMMEPMEEVTKIGSSDISPEERIEKIIRLLVEFAAERKEITLIAFEQNKILPKKSREAFRQTQKNVEKILQKAFIEGVNQGIFDVRDIKMASFAVLAVANWVYRWYKPNGNLTPREIADHFIYFLKYGYMKR